MSISSIFSPPPNALRKLVRLSVDSGAKGGPMVRPHNPETSLPISDHVALVGRIIDIPWEPDPKFDDRHNHDLWRRRQQSVPWKPVASLEELEDLRSRNWSSARREIGVWTDRKKYDIFGSRDGVVQSTEVKKVIFVDAGSNLGHHMGGGLSSEPNMGFLLPLTEPDWMPDGHTY